MLAKKVIDAIYKAPPEFWQEFAEAGLNTMNGDKYLVAIEMFIEKGGFSESLIAALLKHVYGSYKGSIRQEFSRGYRKVFLNGYRGYYIPIAQEKAKEIVNHFLPVYKQVILPIKGIHTRKDFWRVFG